MEARQSLRVPAWHLRYWFPKGSSLVLWLGVLLLVLTSVGSLILVAWNYWYADRIYPGVYISGIPMAGKTHQEALALLADQGLHADQQPLRVVYGDRQWVLRRTPLDSPQSNGNLVDRALQQGRGGHLLENLRTQGFALGTGIHVEPVSVYRAEEIDRFVTAMVQNLATPPRSRAVAGLVPQPAPKGMHLDIGWLVAEIDKAIQEDRTSPINLQVEAVQAGETVLRPTLALGEPLLLSHPQSTHHVALDPQMIAAAVRQEDPLLLDEEVLAAWVQNWVHLFDRPSLDARIRFDAKKGGLYVYQPSQMGVALDIGQTVTAITEALQQGRPEAQLHLVFTEPNFHGRDLDRLGIHELVGSGTSYFRGSSAARIHNIELTTAQFEGILIPPGAVFSFNDNVGPITAAAGFTDSEIIWGDRTAIGVGGGVCQVSTTIFRAAFYAGLPIVERHNHGYVVSWYGQPGLDATIYTPTVDFQFRNDTAAHLLLQPELDAERGTLVFNLYGTKPERTVRISEPAISQIVDPPEPAYLQDSSLAAGEMRLVESEKLGLTVIVKRRIEEGGQVRTDTIHSVYQPWRAVYLVSAEHDPDGTLPLNQTATG